MSDFVEEIRRRVKRICPLLSMNPTLATSGGYCRLEQCMFFNVETSKCLIVEFLKNFTKLSEALEEVASAIRESKGEM